MKYLHVDVFSNVILSGNGLTVVFCEEMLEDDLMLKLTQEFKQFETIFLQRTEDQTFVARIFTVEEELDFAGHPILGAAATVHHCLFDDLEKVRLNFQLNSKMVTTESTRINAHYSVKMNQGKAEFLRTLNTTQSAMFTDALNLNESNVSKQYPMEVVTTGLPYVLMPLESGINHAKIVIPDLEEKLNEVGAKFLYVFDVNTLQARTWDNLGKVEDVATGSAAGPLGAYLFKHMLSARYTEINQGKYVGRPSKIRVSALNDEVFVEGDVSILAKGELMI